jgi:hypothetical protein
MTVTQLQDLLLTTLLRGAGGDRRRWRIALGGIRLYDLATHPHRNWSVTPSGSFAEVAEIERVVDDIGARHPIVSAG